MIREVCQEAVDLIKEFESLHDGDSKVVGLQPKLCPAGIWTVGYGHALTDSKHRFLRGESGKAEAYRQYPSISIDEAENLLKRDLDEFSVGVNRLITSNVNQNQFGALVSLAFNIGLGAFSKSTLLRYVNSGHFYPAADQFLRWNKSGGKILNGLVRRREAERRLFLRDMPEG